MHLLELNNFSIRLIQNFASGCYRKGQIEKEVLRKYRKNYYNKLLQELKNYLSSK